MTDFNDLCDYYIDCLFEDGADAIFAKVNDKKQSYVKIHGRELSSRNPIEFTDNEIQEIQNFVIDTLKSTPNSSFWYGYPILYKKEKIYNSNNFAEYIKPIFYIQIHYNDVKEPIIDFNIIRINKDALQDVGFEIEEIKKFAEVLGLYNDNIEKVELTTLGNKLKEHYPNLKYNEKERHPGIYFNAVIFNSEQSSYTKGLNEELHLLLKRKSKEINKSILKIYLEGFNADIDNKIRFSEKDIYEFFELNENQKKAVLSSFNKNLTVITGPPGTGKSQVVATIIINAAIKNKRILFASKNHKAIKVVEEKLNELSGRPLMIRLGKQDDEKKDLRPALINHLNWLKHTTPKIAKEDLESIELELSSLSHSRDSLINKIECLRFLRNKIIKKIKNFEDLRQDPKNVSVINIFEKLKKSNKIKKKYNLNRKFKITSQYLKSLNDIHKSISFELLLDELEDINKKIRQKSQIFIKSWIELLPDRLDDKKRKDLNDFINVLENLSAKHLTNAVYKRLINRKDVLIESVTEFLHAWCVTNLSARSEIPLIEGFFDILIIDEASQCDIASVIPLLYRSKKVVVLGDPFQLRHITTLGNNRSLELLTKHNNVDNDFNYVTQSFYDLSETRVKKDEVILLNEHFRSHSDIISFSKNYPEWYNGNLLISTDYRNLKPHTSAIENAVKWIKVEGRIEQQNSSGAFIQDEIDTVVKETINLIKNQQFDGEIGVVTPFRLQANKIRVALNNNLSDKERLKLLVESIVKFQGDEKDIIIFSPVVSDNMPNGAEYYLRETPHLFNVAITRARAKLIIIGNFNACINSNIHHISSFAKYVKNLTDGTIKTIEDKGESPYEEILYIAMKEAGLEAIPQFTVGQYRLDFAITQNELKLDIEVDGKIHTDWSGERLKSDIIRNQRLQNLGWKVIRFWTYEIRDSIEYCIDKIRNELNA